MRAQRGTDAATADDLTDEPDRRPGGAADDGPADVSGGDWREVRVHGAAHERDRLLREVARPLLAAPPQDRQGLLVPDLGAPSGTAVLCVQLRPRSDEEACAWLGLAHERARRAGGIGVTDGPARCVPLAGSVFAGHRLAPVTRSVLAAARPAVLELTAAGERGRPALLWTAAELMAAHLRGVSTAGPATVEQLVAGREGVPLGFLSYRSHAEAFVASSRDPQGAQAALEWKYERIATRMKGLVDRVLAQTEGRGPVASPAAAAWFDAVRPARSALAEEFRAGGLRLGDEGPDHANHGELDRSSFHRIVSGSEGLRRFLDEDPLFLATRLLTSLLYLTLQAGGLALAERYLLCHAVSRACEELFGVNALSVVRALAQDRAWD